jgi:hypothetical protein
MACTSGAAIRRLLWRLRYRCGGMERKLSMGSSFNFREEEARSAL